MQVSHLNLEADGAERFEGAARTLIDELTAVLPHPPANGAGVRLFGVEALRRMLEPEGVIGAVAAAFRPGARAVRAILFDKTPETNWSVAWHQDRTISVAERREVDGFGPWSIKSGVHHVAPPFELLAQMVSLRIHLDDISPANAPLLIACGSHRFGRVAEDGIDEAVGRCRIAQCLGRRGDIWTYSTPILHASRPAAEPRRRRVLQVDYAAEALPGGLRWVGV